MGKVQNVYKAIEKVKINDQYGFNILHLKEIAENTIEYYDALYDSFKLGYLQGMKAAKAEMKKGGDVNG